MHLHFLSAHLRWTPKYFISSLSLRVKIFNNEYCFTGSRNEDDLTVQFQKSVQISNLGLRNPNAGVNGAVAEVDDDVEVFLELIAALNDARSENRIIGIGSCVINRGNSAPITVMLTNSSMEVVMAQLLISVTCDPLSVKGGRKILSHGNQLSTSMVTVSTETTRCPPGNDPIKNTHSPHIMFDKEDRERENNISVSVSRLSCLTYDSIHKQYSDTHARNSYTALSNKIAGQLSSIRQECFAVDFDENVGNEAEILQADDHLLAHYSNGHTLTEHVELLSINPEKLKFHDGINENWSESDVIKNNQNRNENTTIAARSHPASSRSVPSSSWEGTKVKAQGNDQLKYEPLGYERRPDQILKKRLSSSGIEKKRENFEEKMNLQSRSQDIHRKASEGRVSKNAAIKLDPRKAYLNNPILLKSSEACYRMEDMLEKKSTSLLKAKSLLASNKKKSTVGSEMADCSPLTVVTDRYVAVKLLPRGEEGEGLSSVQTISDPLDSHLHRRPIHSSNSSSSRVADQSGQRKEDNYRNDLNRASALQNKLKSAEKRRSQVIQATSMRAKEIVSKSVHKARAIKEAIILSTKAFDMLRDDFDQKNEMLEKVQATLDASTRSLGTGYQSVRARSVDSRISQGARDCIRRSDPPSNHVADTGTGTHYAPSTMVINGKDKEKLKMRSYSVPKERFFSRAASPYSDLRIKHPSSSSDVRIRNPPSTRSDVRIKSPPEGQGKSERSSSRASRRGGRELMNAIHKELEWKGRDSISVPRRGEAKIIVPLVRGESRERDRGRGAPAMIRTAARGAPSQTSSHSAPRTAVSHPTAPIVISPPSRATVSPGPISVSGDVTQSNTPSSNVQSITKSQNLLVTLVLERIDAIKRNIPHVPAYEAKNMLRMIEKLLSLVMDLTSTSKVLGTVGVNCELLEVEGSDLGYATPPKNPVDHNVNDIASLNNIDEGNSLSRNCVPDPSSEAGGEREEKEGKDDKASYVEGGSHSSCKTTFTDPSPSSTSQPLVYPSPTSSVARRSPSSFKPSTDLLSLLETMRSVPPVPSVQPLHTFMDEDDGDECGDNLCMGDNVCMDSLNGDTEEKDQFNPPNGDEEDVEEEEEENVETLDLAPQVASALLHDESQVVGHLYDAVPPYENLGGLTKESNGEAAEVILVKVRLATAVTDDIAHVTSAINHLQAKIASYYRVIPEFNLTDPTDGGRCTATPPVANRQESPVHSAHHHLTQHPTHRQSELQQELIEEEEEEREGQLSKALYAGQEECPLFVDPDVEREVCPLSVDSDSDSDLSFTSHLNTTDHTENEGEVGDNREDEEWDEVGDSNLNPANEFNDNGSDEGKERGDGDNRDCADSIQASYHTCSENNTVYGGKSAYEIILENLKGRYAFPANEDKMEKSEIESTVEASILKAPNSDSELTHAEDAWSVDTPIPDTMTEDMRTKDTLTENNPREDSDSSDDDFDLQRAFATENCSVSTDSTYYGRT